MDSAIVVATITASASILVAAVTFWLTKRHQLTMEWRQQKLSHYRELLAALSDLAVDGTDKDEANMRFARAVNTIGLIGSQSAVAALMAYHDEVKYSNSKRSPDRHDELLVRLILAIRQDIGLVKDDVATFNFHLIGKSPT
jgi:hypothetical protein